MAVDPSRYAVNCSILFTELELLDRPAAAKAAGFDAVEFWWPFAQPVPADSEVDRFVRAIEDAGVSLVGLNFFGGDLPSGERGVLSDPARTSEFTDNIDVAVGIGERSGCRAFNALYGNRIDGVDPGVQDDLATETLTRAAKATSTIGGVVLIEPISGVSSYPLKTAEEALAVIDRVHAEGVDNLRLLFDIYHLVANGDDPDLVLEQHPETIGHVQVADVPGRGEPGSGEVDFAHYFDKLDAVGYTGHIGLEYKPTGATVDSFGWIGR